MALAAQSKVLRALQSNEITRRPAAIELIGCRTPLAELVLAVLDGRSGSIPISQWFSASPEGKTCPRVDRRSRRRSAHERTTDARDVVGRDVEHGDPRLAFARVRDDARSHDRPRRVLRHARADLALDPRA